MIGWTGCTRLTPNVNGWVPSVGLTLNGPVWPVRVPASTVAFLGVPNLTVLIGLTNDPETVPARRVTVRCPGRSWTVWMATFGRDVHWPAGGGATGSVATGSTENPLLSEEASGCASSAKT